MSEPRTDRPGTEAIGDELVIEFPHDGDAPVMPDADDIHLSVETHEPPDTEDIRVEWADIARIAGG